MGLGPGDGIGDGRFLGSGMLGTERTPTECVTVDKPRSVVDGLYDTVLVALLDLVFVRVLLPVLLFEGLYDTVLVAVLVRVFV